MTAFLLIHSPIVGREGVIFTTKWPIVLTILFGMATALCAMLGMAAVFGIGCVLILIIFMVDRASSRLFGSKRTDGRDVA